MKISKLFRKTMVCRVMHEEIIDGITYQGLRYYCPTCGEEVFSYQSKCSCGQRLKNHI